MNTLNILLSYNYVKNLVNLTWNDILYAINNGYLPEDAAIDYAIDVVQKEEEPKKIILDLASLFKGETIRPYLNELAGEITENNDISSEKKILFLILNWVYEHKESYSEPLEIVEHIYADFDFPNEIADFIRYMPTNQPDLNSLEKSEMRLYQNWKQYLDKQKERYQ